MGKEKEYMEKELREAGTEFGIKCKSCGNIFYATVDNHYIAGEPKGKTDIISIMNNYKTFYDAYDCPFCGTQHIMGERKDVLRGRTKEQHEFIHIHPEAFESSVSDDTKKRVLAGLLGARIEMRKKNMLTVDAMIALTDGLIYLVTGGEKIDVGTQEKPEEQEPDEITLILTSESLPECFGKYDEENAVECGCCKLKHECKIREMRCRHEENK